MRPLSVPSQPAGARRAIFATATRRASIVLLAGIAAGCALGADAPPLSSLSEAELDERIERVEQEIAQDHEILEALVGQPRNADSPPLHENAALREIAGRLSDREEERIRLRAERASR